MATLSEHVIETTVYEIVCSECATRTDEHSCEEDAIYEAELIGFEIIDDCVYCPECAE